MAELTPEKAREILNLDIGDNDSGERTVGGYLRKLLRDVWIEQEGFNGKRPFGNSGWDRDIKAPMLRAGLITGTLDEEGYIEELDDDQADELVLAVIDQLGIPE